MSYWIEAKTGDLINLDRVCEVTLCPPKVIFDYGDGYTTTEKWEDAEQAIKRFNEIKDNLCVNFFDKLEEELPEGAIKKCPDH